MPGWTETAEEMRARLTARGLPWPIVELLIANRIVQTNGTVWVRRR